jgi:glutathione synthase/RimK-type ligase-like ATP-grasp enzyme
MTTTERDERAARAQALLRRHGLHDAVVSTAGAAAEVAAIQAPPETAATLRRLAPALRALGFRYVALDLSATARGPSVSE